MAQQVDFALERFDDGTLNLDMVPPANLGGVDIRYHMWRRRSTASGFVSGLVLKRCNSGYGDGVSGITVVDSGAGRISVALFGTDISGSFDQGLFFYNIVRFVSGQVSVLVEGHRLLT